MDKENNPVPENDSGDKGQEEKPTTFTQEQVNDIVSKRLAEANSKAKLAGTSPEDYGDGTKPKNEAPKSPTGLRSF